MDVWESDLNKLLSSVRRGTILTEEHALGITYNLLCSLAFLHKSGVVHRDLKPANILIGDNCQVKIIDFGLSRTTVDENTVLRDYRTKYWTET